MNVKLTRAYRIATIKKCSADISVPREILRNADDKPTGPCKQSAKWSVQGKFYCPLHAMRTSLEILSLEPEIANGTKATSGPPEAHL